LETTKWVFVSDQEEMQMKVILGEAGVKPSAGRKTPSATLGAKVFAAMSTLCIELLCKEITAGSFSTLLSVLRLDRSLSGDA
jgi:hypothetical protein